MGIEGQTSCRCCGQGGLCLELDRALAVLLSMLPVGASLIITSGYRCRKNNDRCGGSKNSQHMAGRAVDLYSPDLTVQELAAGAEEIPIFRGSGIGLYVGERQWVHLDVRGWRARWAERDGEKIRYEEAMRG